MGNHKISLDLKDIAIELWHHGWDWSDICNLLHHSQSSLYQWLATYELFGTMENRPAPLRGHPRVIGLAALEAIHQYLAIHHDLPVSISALQDNLQKADLTQKVLHKIAAEADENWKMLFRAGIKNLAHFTGTGIKFVAIDESSKDERTWVWHYGRSPVGTNADLSDVFVQGIMLFYLPPYCPDLNPIKESFSAYACGCVTADMAYGWFKHAGYIVTYLQACSTISISDPGLHYRCCSWVREPGIQVESDGLEMAVKKEVHHVDLSASSASSAADGASAVAASSAVDSS
ncbi:hypothetical protein F5146DRAFT_995409 [Armillaria mellea]|nr:hypothetical protein F5146DRAFT_995409 [Armillaria mellea]